MGALDPAKILVILVIALVVLGPERLPKVAREAGAMWRQLTQMREQVVSELKDALPDDLPSRDDFPRIPRVTPGAVSGFMSGLITPDQTDDEKIDAAIAKAHADDLDGAVASSQHPDSYSIPVGRRELDDVSFDNNDPNMN